MSLPTTISRWLCWTSGVYTVSIMYVRNWFESSILHPWKLEWPFSAACSFPKGLPLSCSTFAISVATFAKNPITGPSTFPSSPATSSAARKGNKKQKLPQDIMKITSFSPESQKNAAKWKQINNHINIVITLQISSMIFSDPLATTIKSLHPWSLKLIPKNDAL